MAFSGMPAHSARLSGEEGKRRKSDGVSGLLRKRWRLAVDDNGENVSVWLKRRVRTFD
jgi:hypothetical protein